MKKTLTYSFLSGIMLLISCLAFSQENWELTKEDDNIKVYFKKINAQHFSIRIKANFTANKQEVIDIIQDHKSYPIWVYRCIKTEEFNIDGKEYLRTITDVPWPFKDRDAVNYIKPIQIVSENTSLIHSISKPNIIPHYEDFIRVEQSEVKWKITQSADKLTHIEYTLSLEIKQEAPEFIVKMISTNAPYETFKNLEAILKSKN